MLIREVVSRLGWEREKGVFFFFFLSRRVRSDFFSIYSYIVLMSHASQCESQAKAPSILAHLSGAGCRRL